MTAMAETAVPTLLAGTTEAKLSPLSEGNNISYAMGFKHINYLAEAAVGQHFKQRGLAISDLYRRYALDFDVVDLASRLGALLVVDDDVTAKVTALPVGEDNRLRFRVVLTAQRDGAAVKISSSTLSVVLRADSHVPPNEETPDELRPFVVNRVATGTGRALAVRPDPTWRPGDGRGTSVDPVLHELTSGTPAFGWKWRIPYFYCHYNEHMKMSGYLRIMEEVVDLFLADRGLPIKRVLDERNWIPVVTTSDIHVLDEVEMEEDLYTVYTPESAFKNLFYTSRMDTYVVRGGELVHTSTGHITHGYITERAANDWVLAELDDATIAALLGTGTASS